MKKFLKITFTVFLVCTLSTLYIIAYMKCEQLSTVVVYFNFMIRLDSGPRADAGQAHMHGPPGLLQLSPTMLCTGEQIVQLKQ